MPPTKVIQIAGIPCAIKGNTEEELRIDEDLARELAYRCKADSSVMMERFCAFQDMITLAKELQSTIPSIVFLKTHHYSDEDILKAKEE